MSTFSAPLSVGPCAGCCAPTASISYVSATGSVSYQGYIDPRYMTSGVEFGSKSSSGTIPNYSAGKPYSTIHRVFSSGKFYKSIQDPNLGNTPATSPLFWTEVEAPRHWLTQALLGTWAWLQMTFCNNPTPCTSSIPPGTVFANSPGPGMNCTRREVFFAGGGTVDHATGIETWTGSYDQYDHASSGPGSHCIQGPFTATVTTQTTVLNTFLNSITLGAMFRQASAAESTTFNTNIPSCVGGASFGQNCAVYILSSLPQRLFSSPEIASSYLTPSGSIASTLSGTWTDAWTQATARSCVATFAMTGGVPLTAYTLTVNYTASGGPTPPSEVYPFTTDGSGNATVIVNLPFGGGGGQTVSIGSYVIA